MMRRLRLDRRGASAAEFALVLPLLILFLFGILDGGRLLWDTNKAEKATQMGARYAVVTAPLAPGLASANYVGVGGLTQGDLIPKSAFGRVECSNAGCCVSGTTCTSPYPTLGTFTSGQFTNIVNRMRLMKPDITESQVRVIYSGSGLGFAGDPNGMDIAPLVTVELSGVQFSPLVLFGAANINLPSFRTTLTAEDMQCPATGSCAGASN